MTGSLHSPGSSRTLRAPEHLCFDCLCMHCDPEVFARQLLQDKTRIAWGRTAMSTSKRCRTNKWDQTKGTRRQKRGELTEMACGKQCLHILSLNYLLQSSGEWYPTGHRNQEAISPWAGSKRVNGSKEDNKWSLQIHEDVRIPLANSPVR